MKPEIKQLWVDALRSGYEQTKGQLRRDDCFCVWGVLCDLATKDPRTGVVWDGSFIQAGQYSNCYVPINAVREWAGLNEDVYLDIGDYHQVGLTSHNDCYNVTFQEFADAIEAQL